MARGECLSCGRDRQLRSRKLCETCWTYARKMGTLDQFPLKHKRSHGAGRHSPGVPQQAVMNSCGCFDPIEEPIPPWGVQCLKCKRPILR